MDQLKRIQDFVEATFGSHDSLLAHQIITHSIYALPCDVTFRDRKPFLDVPIDETIGQSLISGADPETLQQSLNHIRFSNGETAKFNEILLVLPMPVGGYRRPRWMRSMYLRGTTWQGWRAKRHGT